jgi:hypothetical protein
MWKLNNILLLLLVTSCGPIPECEYKKVDDGVLEVCSNGDKYLYSNNNELENGIVKEIIEPCPEIESNFSEVILVMGDGTLIAFFAGGGGFLTILEDGNYVTTDSKSCLFTVVNGEVMW